jgi:putative Mn2+ efflux pump MntP
MFSLETGLMGIALALDAAVVSFAIGLLNLESSHKLKISRGLAVCSLFGFFQFLMVWLGSLGGYLLSFSSYGYLFQLVVAAIFLVIAVRILQESLDDDDEHIEWGLIPLLILAIATSIDALAAGVSLGTFPQAYLSALEIGIVTFFICLLAFGSSNVLKQLPTRWLLRSASVIFFFLGGRILYDYYF